MKKVAEFVSACTTIGSALLLISSLVFWYTATHGSWRNSVHGCFELDLRPTLEGVLVSPSGNVLTKYSGGFTILNWVSFKFTEQRNRQITVSGIGTGFINPVARTLTIKYKIQEDRGILIDGYRETVGIVFNSESKKCTTDTLIG